MRYVIPSLCLLLAGCHVGENGWEGYAFRDGPARHDTRLIGAYGSVEACRSALLAEPSDPGSESLVCAYKCEKVGGEPGTCVESVVVRVADSAKSGSFPQPAP